MKALIPHGHLETELNAAGEYFAEMHKSMFTCTRARRGTHMKLLKHCFASQSRAQKREKYRNIIQVVPRGYTIPSHD